jgi:quinol monooxygenase YgiN
MMSLRLTYLNVKPGKLEDLRERWNSMILTEVRNTPGHHSSHFMEDMVDPRNAIGWIVWDEPEIAQLYEQGPAYRSHVDLVRDLLESEPYIRHYHFLKQPGS